MKRRMMERHKLECEKQEQGTVEQEDVPPQKQLKLLHSATHVKPPSLTDTPPHHATLSHHLAAATHGRPTSLTDTPPHHATLSHHLAAATHAQPTSLTDTPPHHATLCQHLAAATHGQPTSLTDTHPHHATLCHHLAAATSTHTHPGSLTDTPPHHATLSHHLATATHGHPTSLTDTLPHHATLCHHQAAATSTHGQPTSLTDTSPHHATLSQHHGQQVSASTVPVPESSHLFRPWDSIHHDQQEIVVPTPESPSLLSLWDRANPDQQEIVARSVKYKDLLRKKLHGLTGFVQLPQMWPHLIALDVIDHLGKDRIVLNVTEADAVVKLVRHLETGPTWKLHGFIRTMAITQQQHIIHHLGLKPSDYEDPPAPCQPPPSDSHLTSATRSATKAQKTHYYKKVESEEMIQISSDLLPGLLQHCGSYNQSLMKTCLFGYKKNVPIDLTRIYVCHDASCKKNQREKVPVGKKELFLSLFGERCLNCLSMEGPAGTGKSSYLEEYALDWSQDLTSCEQKGPDAVCEGHMWKLIVYIPAGGIRGSAADAIKGNLRCKPHTQDQIMHAIEEDGEGVLIMYDAMDELHNKDSIESISSYTQTAQKMAGKAKVIVTARDGLLSVEHSIFDRELHLEGFSLPQGISYMKQYFKEVHALSDHPVLQYVEAHPKDLEWVLSNPLRVHIFSELTACGFLTLQDVKTLTTVKLFRSLDQLLLKRDKECRTASTAEASNFYEVCLRCLITDQRILSETDLGPGSPYISLLQRHNYVDQDFNDFCHYSFPHEMLLEYFSMRGLIECLMSDVEYKQGMLLWLCSNKKMRNVLQLTCGYIAQYEPQLLPDVVFIIRACLLMQTEYVHCEKNELTQKLLQLPALIQETFPNILTHGLTAEQTTQLDVISNHVQAMFSEKANQLKEAAWFLNGFLKPESIQALSPFHRFLLGCLQQLTSQQLEDVFSQTINLLLPCTGLGGNLKSTVVPIDGVRWATVQEAPVDTGLRINIDLWSPCDLASVLNTWKHLPQTQQLLQQQKLQQNIKYVVHIAPSAHSLCTSLPADPWSEEQWTPGVRELLLPRYCTGGIQVAMSYSTSRLPLSGVLSACRRLITPGHGLTQRLTIIHGQVKEEELLGFCTWAGEVGLCVNLAQPTVVLGTGRGKEDWKDADSDIRRLMGFEGLRIFIRPTYITSGGEVLCTKYDPNTDNALEDSY